MTRKGPIFSIHASCLGCHFEDSGTYRFQSDSGLDVRCAHPDAPLTNYIGDSTWNTPSWCPLRAAALEAFIAEVKS